MSIRCPDCGAIAGYGHELGHKSDCPSLHRRPERGIDKARRELVEAKVREKFDEFGAVLAAGVKLKKIMVEQGLTAAKAKCPICGGADTLKGRLVIGRGAGRHRSSGGAFRMWCETEGCGAAMME